MSREFTVVNGFNDTLDGTVAPVYRKPGQDYPPTGVKVTEKWLDYLEAFRNERCQPLLKVKPGKRKEVSEILDTEEI